MSGKYPTKKQLTRMVKLHTEAIKYIPVSDAMLGRMTRLLKDLEDRLKTYDDFLVNPYKTHTSKPKFNSDAELDLGEYDIPVE